MSAASDADAASYELTQASGTTLATLAVRNRPLAFEAIKRDGDTGDALAGVTFALHKQRAVDGVTQFDTEPLAGYEALVTDAQGRVPKLDETLPPGTYQLRETTAKAGYKPLAGYVHFTVGENGAIVLGQVPDGVALVGTADVEDGAEAGSGAGSGAGAMLYVLTIPNSQRADIVLRKTDESGNALVGAKFGLCKLDGMGAWAEVDGYGQIDMATVSEVVLGGLDAGRYRLVESSAPSGYIVLSSGVYFTLGFASDGSVRLALTDAEGAAVEDDGTAFASGSRLTVRNTSGTALPMTGGGGVAGMYLVGVALVAGAAVALVVRWRQAG